MFESLVAGDIVTYVVIPLLIFFARIVDVSLGTLRVIYISKGYRNIAPLLGFFEVIVWLVAISRVMENLSNIYCYLAYGAGFAAGTYIGMRIEDRVSIGKVSMRIVTRREANELLERINATQHRPTVIEAESSRGPSKVLFLTLRRHEVPEVVGLIKHYDPKAFYSIEEVRFAIDEEVPLPKPKKKYLRKFGVYRKER